jgi:hypothetical protein
MIEFKPENFYIAMWFVDQPSPEYREKTGVPNMNWMACLYRFPNGLVKATYRFAYWDENENLLDKNWYSGQHDSLASDTELIEGLDKMMKMISIRNGDAFSQRVNLNVTGDKALAKLQSLKLSWLRIRSESRPE